MTSAKADSGSQLYPVRALRNISDHEAYRAARYSAEMATDPDDCAELLSALGIPKTQIRAGRLAARRAGAA